jgi:hypothetical protein
LNRFRRTMNRKARLLSAALATLGVLALGACGGGGSAPPATVPPVSTDVTVQGIVAKGPATGATVSIFATGADGKRAATAIKIVKTGTGGAYSAQIPKQTTPIVIEANLEGADIANELVPGTTYKGKAGEKMLAALPLNGSLTVANVTPFSDMAAAMAVSHGGTDTFVLADVEAANKKIRDLTIDDPLTAAPTTDLATKLTAVAQFVEDVHGGNLNAGLQELRDACKFDPAKNGFIVTAAVSTKLAEACTASDCATDNNFASSIIAETAVAPSGSVTAVDAVKALIQDLRDTINAYSNPANTGELDTAGEKLKQAVNASTGFIDMDSAALAASIGKGYEFFQYRKSTPGATDVYTSSLSTQYQLPGGSVFGRLRTFDTAGNPMAAGMVPKLQCELATTATKTTADGGLDITNYTVATGTTTAANINAYSCYGIGTVGRLYENKLLDTERAFWNSMTIIPKANGGFDFVHQARSIPFDRRVSAESTRYGTAYSGTGTWIKDANGNVTSFSLKGRMSPGFAMLQTPTLAERSQFAYNEVDLSFGINWELGLDGQYHGNQMTVGGSQSLVKTDSSVASSMTIAAGSLLAQNNNIVETRSYYDWYFAGSGSCPVGYFTVGIAPNIYCSGMRTYTTTVSELSAMNLGVTVAMPNAKFEGSITAGTPSFDVSKTAYTPTAGSLIGKVYEGDGAGGYRLLLDGKLSGGVTNYASFNASAPETASNTFQRYAAFEGKVLLKNRPEMGLTMNVLNDAFNSEKFSGTFMWNNKSFSLQGSQNGNPSSGSLTVTNSDGVRVVIPKPHTTALIPITKGGLTVGLINPATKRIDYTDGTYQQY